MKRPILVTGSARAGTTWVGRTLSHGRGTAYVSEPFNPAHPPCACGVRVEHHYTYASEHNSDVFEAHVTHLLAKLSRVEMVNALRGTVRERRSIHARRMLARLMANRVLVKDPLAVFSSEWLASRFDMDVVVVIRHPAAVVNSYLELGWTHDFSQFLAQTELMEEHLHPFAPRIEQFTRSEQEPLDQAALLWKLVYHKVLDYQGRHGRVAGWTFIRHEELSRAPIETFARLYDRLGLEFTAATRRFISGTTDRRNAKSPTDPYAIRRNTESNLTRWRAELSPKQLTRIRRIVGAEGEALYPDEEW